MSFSATATPGDPKRPAPTVLDERRTAGRDISGQAALSLRVAGLQSFETRAEQSAKRAEIIACFEQISIERCKDMSPSERIKTFSANRSPAWTLLGIGAIAYEETANRVVIDLNAEQRHCHSIAGHPKGGIVQGGIVTGWLDVAMATACLVDGMEDTAVASLEIKVTFLLPAHPGLYRSYGTIIRRGRSIGFMEAELRDAQGVLIARASSTAAVRTKIPSSGAAGGKSP